MKTEVRTDCNSFINLLALHKAGLSSNPSGHCGIESHTCSKAIHVGDDRQRNGLSSSQGLPEKSKYW